MPFRPPRQFWSQFLWDLALRLGDFQPVDEVLLLGVLLTGPHPSFYELADAMVAADAAIHGGVNRAAIIAAMTARGFYPRPPEVSSAQSPYPLLLWKTAVPGQYNIAWEDLGPGADGYNIYERGDAGAVPRCSPSFTRLGNGWNAYTLTTGPGDFYYVVTAWSGGVEGPCCFLWLPGRGDVKEHSDDLNGCPP